MGKKCVQAVYGALEKLCMNTLVVHTSNVGSVVSTENIFSSTVFSQTDTHSFSVYIIPVLKLVLHRLHRAYDYYYLFKKRIQLRSNI